MGLSSANPGRDASPTWVRYRVLIWLCLAATIAYIPRTSIGVAEEDIRSDLCLTLRQMSWVISAFFITYAVFQIPTGWLGHVWGPRRGLPYFSLTWSIFTALFGAAGVASVWLSSSTSVSFALVFGFALLMSARLGMGAAQAGLFPCAAVTVGHWFPISRRALPSGALGAFMSIGSAAAVLLTGFLMEGIGWRLMYVLYAVPGIIWAAGFWDWFRDRPREHPEVNAAELAQIEEAKPVEMAVPAGGAEPTPWGLIATSPAMWWISGQQFFRAAGYTFFASWFATYLKRTHDVSTRDAAILNTIPLVAVVLGSLAGGLVSDWVLSRTGSRRLARQLVAVVSLLLCAPLILLSYGIDDVRVAVLLISAGSFCAAHAGPCAYTITIDMGGKHVAPVFSVMNMAGNVGAAVFPPAVAELVERTGNWNGALFVFAGVYVAAAFCWLLLNPRGTVFDRQR